MVNRIKELLNKENLNYGSFADEIGVQRSSLSHILNGRNNPSLDFVIKTLQRFPNVSPEWFLLGNGPMYKSVDEKDQISSEINMTQDLFSNITPEPVPGKEETEKELTPEVTINEEIKINKKERYVSQILIFYSDSTYQVYKPEK